MPDNLIKDIIKSNKFVSDDDKCVVDKSVAFRLKGGKKSDLILGYPIKGSNGPVELNELFKQSDGKSNSNCFQFKLTEKGLVV